jgi:probable rRNA maturation factor
MIIEINNRTKSEINTMAMKKIATKFMNARKKNGKELSMVFVGDKEMRRLNRVYRKIDKTTDVLSFDGDEDIYGEIIICCQQIRRQAKKFGKSTESELAFILVHGLLHLEGYNDETEKERLEMIRMGEEFLKNI